ncbi:hypothetical protein GIB67_036355 [Kingdonia uniflora]|uniref:Bifunctional inhibitor/plant lipid transfer protein/seed storage helical domain-containing protein n=1 Tax=Kingdonia uniflora TaxID=39325 RepID=A0A7J7L434_9MAGN|nr:hypothetical protein GIB67_036355 [Kingdonia uniflora]
MKVSVFALVVIFLVLVNESHVSTAVTCDINELYICHPSIMTQALPSEACCAKIREHEPCSCQYLKNPVVRGYLTLGITKKLENTCHVPYPNC